MLEKGSILHLRDSASGGLCVCSGSWSQGRVASLPCLLSWG